MQVNGKLPDFIIIGAQKGATSSVWHYLKAHPEVYLPTLKETYFFVREGSWHRGLEWYTSLFSGCKPHQVTGEATPGYTMFPYFDECASLIKATAPAVKLIYLIRDPVERMISSWAELRADCFEFDDLGTALRQTWFYSAVSQYATQLKQYLKHFPPESILVLRTEDLELSPRKTMTLVCDFIGIDPALLPNHYMRHNESRSRRIPNSLVVDLYRVLPRRLGGPLVHLEARHQSLLTRRRLRPEELELSPEMRLRLAAYFEVEMQELRRIVGPEMDLWGYA